MKNIKTPIIQPLRTQGGTFYTFASAVEDVGLNITDRTDSIKMSHYALLDIPMCDEYTTNNTNKFNIFSMPGAVAFRTDEKYLNSFNINPNINVAQSFLSYALNLENTLVNREKYDYTTGLSVSERVFWKWLKETGAIRWHKDEYGNILEGDKNTSIEYNNVVKAIGKIDAVNNRSGDYGIYNEIYVNIPSSLGDMPIYFIQKGDNNYNYGMQIKTDATIEDVNEEDYFITDSSLYNVAFTDYVNDDNINDYITTDGEKGIWCKKINNVLSLDDTAGNYYIIDDQLTDNDNENNVVNISYNDTSYSFIRSKYDCMQLDVLLNSEIYNELTYDELAKNGKDYKFNTILLYYSVIDANGKNKATNLYGVYFIDSPKISINETPESDSILNALEFYIPSLNKIKSTEEGFGTAYSFKINMRTSSIYDNTKAPIIDNSSSENSIVNDFNDVLANLNTSIDLLNKHVKHSSIISEKYNVINEQVYDIQNKIIELNTNVNNIIDQKTGFIKCDVIDTNKLIVNEDARIKYNNDISGNTEIAASVIDGFLKTLDVVNVENELFVNNNLDVSKSVFDNKDLNNLIFAILYKLKHHDKIINQISYPKKKR